MAASAGKAKGKMFFALFGVIQMVYQRTKQLGLHKMPMAFNIFLKKIKMLSKQSKSCPRNKKYIYSVNRKAMPSHWTIQNKINPLLSFIAPFNKWFSTKISLLVSFWRKMVSCNFSVFGRSGEEGRLDVLDVRQGDCAAP